MKNLPPSHSPRRDHGVALVLVLCFVVLITGLVVAYFSRTLNTRQLSNASTSTEQAEQLANSATDVILGDFKQEIANGSTLVSGLPTGVTVYTPTVAANAVPQRNVAPTPAPNATPAIGPIPNLVRSSLRSDTTVGNGSYVPPPGVTSRASAAASSTPSANGRSVSTARWNRHYLIPTAADPGPAPTLTASAPIAAFTAPDWVFVTAEKGPDVLTGPKSDASGTVTPIGRYAYAIYDEGGLLDINHTGFPSASSLSHIGSKFPPSYADLTQLPAAGAAPLTSTIVDNLLGWRNFATLQPSGTFPSLLPAPSPAASPDSAYYNLFASSSTSPLQVALTVYNNKTDQMFLSRQQLIGYFAAAGLDPAYLQYFATFTRGLNQPSYAPEANRPPVLPYLATSVPAGSPQGGNDSYLNTSITPNFLTARVVNAFANPNLPSNPNTRYDGTPVLIGEPLVKKRFPLNRLAWLTYKGPSASRSQTDPDMVALINNGITPSFLSQGTAANIATYFGLQWNATTKWTYIHGTNGTTGPILNVSNPTATTDVAHLSPGREPDFFELLKASINPGSIAKASTSSTILNDDVKTTHAAQNQFNNDVSVDRAILQIGANIIDQFDTDGFPTQINYSVGGTAGTGTVYGVENLPYIARVRSGLIRLKEAIPPETTVSPTSQPSSITDTGVAALMNYPEIWNPHDWSSNSLAESAGVVSPTQFQIYAQTSSIGPNLQQDAIYAVNNIGLHSSYDADTMKSPGFSSVYGFPFGSNPGGELRALNQTNTEMDFSIDYTSTTSESLFREPTVLYQPGIPSGSSLVSKALVSTTTGLGILANNKGNWFNPQPGGGLVSSVTGSVGSPKLPTTGSPYIGFYIGAQPQLWYDKDSSSFTPAYQTFFGPVNDVMYVLACGDGQGGTITYDMKALTTTGPPNAVLQTSVDAGFGLNGTVGAGMTLDFGLRHYPVIDPRTARFCMVDPWISDTYNGISPRQGNFYNQAANTLMTPRSAYNSGDCWNFFTGTDYQYTATDWYTAVIGWYHDANLGSNDTLRPGLLSQNNPLAPSDRIVTSVTTVPPGTNYTDGTAYAPFYYADADGVVRRASGGNVPVGTSGPVATTASPYLGLAMASAKGTSPAFSSGTIARQMDSRPVILNRPFRSVAELGYVFSGTPWKNLDFFLPESGDAAILDVFCVNDSSDPNGMMAGQVSLNTRQVPVLQAILAGTTKDLWNDASALAGTSSATIVGGTATGAQAQAIAQLLVTRTAVGPAAGVNQGIAQPLQYVSDLVGRFVNKPYVYVVGASGSNAAFANAGINGQKSCDGFSADLANLTSTAGTSPDTTMHAEQRFGESAIRALANGGQTRVWNLMFDVVAQTGRYGTQATNLDQFNVEGEQHYWVHVAIDRFTGQILDKQVEVVKE